MTEDLDAQSLETMDAIDSSGPGMFKTCMIIAKAGYTVKETLKAAKCWLKSDLPMGKPAALVLVLCSVSVMLGAAYKFTSKKIMPLYLLQFIGNYCAFCVLHVLIGYVPCEAGKERQQAISKKFKLLHVLQWIMAIVGSQFAHCHDDAIYPIPFIVNLIWVFALFAYAKMKTPKSYGIKFGKDEEKAKLLFDAQIARFYLSIRFVFTMQLIAVIFGTGKLTKFFTEEIQCAADGKMWVYTGSKGNFFIILHIIGGMMASGIARAVFIKTAKGHGIFPEITEDDDKAEQEVTKKKQ